MSNKNLFIVAILNLFIFSFPCIGYSLDENTHAELNKGIAYNTYGLYSLDGTLRNKYNLINGIETTFNENRIWRWIELGGNYEDMSDIPYVRSFNHFHDPLEPWGQAGYSGPAASLDPMPICSSILWAQATDQYFGNYSWVNARDYFYKALTAQNDTDRNNNFADTFRALGQVMHLVQDASVPAHTRNDGHLLYNYENWVFDIQDTDPTYFNQLLSNSSITVDPSLFSTSVDPAATIPIAGIFDSNKYSGANPDVTTGTVGLAEYTNANFFSEDTVFKDYTYPSYSSTATMYVGIPDPEDATKIVSRPYYTKAKDGDTSFYLLATQGYLSDYVHTHFDWLSYQTRQFEKPALDENCYDNYARMLLPRAIAYSSELLRYFFRGDLDAVEAKAVTTDGKISGMTLKVKNNTSGEDMDGGTLVVSYRYKNAEDADYTYGVSDQTTSVSISSANTSDEYTVTFSDPIPSDATEVEYMLVYRGKLGAEDDAVAAKTFAPKEPLVIDDWESGQNWTAIDPRSTLSLDSTTYYQGAGALKIAIASGALSGSVFPVVKSCGYSWTTFWEGYSWVNDGTYYGKCVFTSTDEQMVYGMKIDKVKINGKLTDASTGSVSEVVWPIGTSGRNYNYLPNPNGFWNVTARIYGNDGDLPGALLAESDPIHIPVSGFGYYHFAFGGPVKLGGFDSYNVSLYAPYPQDEKMLVGHYEGDKPGTQVRTLEGQAIMSLQVYCATEAGPQGATHRDGQWSSRPSLPCPSVLVNIQGGPLAQATIPKDCTGKDTFKFAVKSALTGNVVNFVYGTDEEHTVDTPLDSTKTDWEAMEIPIDESMDKSKLSYFAFKLGTDAIDASTGKSIANTIYIDQLVAE